jgi:stage III sporulation protein AH
VLYVNKKSALFVLLLSIFILVSAYSLLANRIQAPSSSGAPDARAPSAAPAAPASDKAAKTQQQAGQQLGLLPVMPDLTREEFFVECRLDRDRVRSEQMAILKEIAEQTDSSGGIRDSAQQELMQLTENMAKETELEKLVMARGYNDAAVMILTRSATVVVQVRSLLPSEVEQIKSLVSKTTGLDAGSVFVIPKA